MAKNKKTEPEKKPASVDEAEQIEQTEEPEQEASKAEEPEQEAKTHARKIASSAVDADLATLKPVRFPKTSTFEEAIPLPKKGTPDERHEAALEYLGEQFGDRRITALAVSGTKIVKGITDGGVTVFETVGETKVLLTLSPKGDS